MKIARIILLNVFNLCFGRFNKFQECV